MSHLTKAILWLAFALLMVFCCVIDVINQAWFAFAICAIGFVFDIVDASVEFSAWARKTEEDDDT
jgi:hypothetical protein